MNEAPREGQPQEQPPIPLVHSLGYGAGTMLVAGMVDLLAHLGPTGLVVGGIIAYAAARHGPELVEQVRENLPSPASPQPSRQTRTVSAPQQSGSQSKRTLLDRALGRFPAEEETKQDAEPSAPDKDTRLLPSDGADDDTRVIDEANLDREIEEDMQAQGGKVAAIIGDNPRRRLDMAPNFQPDANSLAGTGLAAFGMQGSGKTNVLMRFVEQYVERFHLSCVIFDSQGDGLSLVEDGFVPNGHIATPGRVPSMQAVVTYGLQVVFDLSAWHQPDKVGMDREMAAGIMVKAINALMVAQKAMQPRRTCLVVIDETQLWVPQSRIPGGVQPVTASELYNAIMALATTGRKLGLMPLLAAQRIATVHNDVIGSVETRIFGKADLDNDLRRYREYFGELVATDAQIRSFGPGEMVVCMGGKRLLVQFKKRDTRHVSHTPSVTTDLEQFSRKLPPELLALLTRPAEVAHPTPSIPTLAPRSEFRHGEYPALSKEPSRSGSLTAVAQESPARLMPQEMSTREADRTQHFTKELGPELQAAYATYRPGMRHHTLARHLGTTPSLAGHLLKQLQMRGLIDAAGNKKGEKVVPILPEARRRAADIDLDEAIRAWNEGHNSEDKLMRRFGVTKYQAGLLRDRILQATPGH